MFEHLLEISAHPVWVFMAIVLASYIYEDAAIVFAALLAADGTTSLSLAFSAIAIGIITGDLGLYGLGYLAQRFPSLRRRLFGQDQGDRFLPLFRLNFIKNILLVRFAPGLRFLFYTACGLFKANVAQFIVGVSVATALWVSVVFTLIYLLGATVWQQYGHWQWTLLPVILLLLYAANRKVKRRFAEAGPA